MASKVTPKSDPEAGLTAGQKKLPPKLRAAILRRKGRHDVKLTKVARADIELGKDGSKWKHGYIPENPAAVALKMHRKPGSSSKMRSTDGASSRAAAARKGGFSLNKNGDSPKGGYMVSYANDKGGVEHTVDGPVTANHVRRHAAAAAKQLQDSKNYQGAWKDEDSGKTYLDVSKNVDNLEDARKMANEHKQLAIYDVKNNKSIKTSALNRSAGQKQRRAAENSNVLLTKKEQKAVNDREAAKQAILNYGKSSSTSPAKAAYLKNHPEHPDAQPSKVRTLGGHGVNDLKKLHKAKTGEFGPNSAPQRVKDKAAEELTARGYHQNAAGTWVNDDPKQEAKMRKVAKAVNRGKESDEDSDNDKMNAAIKATPLAKKPNAKISLTPNSVQAIVTKEGADRTKWPTPMLRLAAKLGDSLAARQLLKIVKIHITPKSAPKAKKAKADPTAKLIAGTNAKLGIK